MVEVHLDTLRKGADVVPFRQVDASKELSGRVL